MAIAARPTKQPLAAEPVAPAATATEASESCAVIPGSLLSLRSRGCGELGSKWVRSR